MRHGGERADHRQLAHVAAAEIGLESPDRNKHRSRNAELPLNARKKRGVALQKLPAALNAARRHAGRGVTLEAHPERAALAPVEGEHRLVGRDARERGVDDRAGNARARRLARHRADEVAEVAAALRRGGGCREQKRENERRWKMPDHAKSFFYRRCGHRMRMRLRQRHGGPTELRPPEARMQRQELCWSEGAPFASRQPALKVSLPLTGPFS